jgi:hypothetical protein
MSRRRLSVVHQKICEGREKICAGTSETRARLERRVRDFPDAPIQPGRAPYRTSDSWHAELVPRTTTRARSQRKKRQLLVSSSSLRYKDDAGTRGVPGTGAGRTTQHRDAKQREKKKALLCRAPIAPLAAHGIAVRTIPLS